MYFNSDIRLVDCNINSTSTCISNQTFDRSTAILIQQVHVFQFRHSTAILIQQVHVFQFGHSTSRLNINSTSTCISIRTFDRSTQY